MKHELKQNNQCDIKQVEIAAMSSKRNILFDILSGCAREYELQEKIDDLRPTEDREASKESHGAADQTQLCI